MNCNNCSICPISGLANDVLPLVFDGFFRFMPFSEFDEIPLYAGEDFVSRGVHCNVILDPNAADSFHIYARFNRYHITGFESKFLSPCYPRLLVHFQSQAVPGAVHKILSLIRFS